MGLTKAQLEALNDSSFPNNNGGLITPQILRDYNDATIANTVNQDAYTADSASFNTRINAITSSVTSAITASSLITASFDNGTRNLTFTKGDATTFNVNIPDASGSAGDFVTTASFNAYTASNNTVVNALVSATASYADSASVALVDSNQQAQIDALIAFTGSVTASIDTGSFATTGSNTFTGIQNFTADITASNTFINGDLNVLPNTVTNLNGNTNVQNFLYVGGGLTLNTPAEIVWVDTSGSIGSGFSASVDARINAIVTGTGFATTGSNTFTGNQTVSASILLTGNVEMNQDVNAGILYPMSGSKSIRIQKQVGINRLSWVDQDNDKLLYLDVDSGVFFVSGNFQAGLQNGYAWVGQADGYSGQVATSSFGGSTTLPSGLLSSSVTNFTDYSASVDSRINAITGSGGSVNTGSLMVTGSISGNTLTFTKGDASTFDLIIPSASGSVFDTGSFATTGSNTFNGDQSITGSVSVFLPKASGKQFRVDWGNAGSASMFTEESGGPNQSLIIVSASIDLRRGGIDFTSGSIRNSGDQIQFNASPSASFILRTSNGGVAEMTAFTDFTDLNRPYGQVRASSDGSLLLRGNGGSITLTGSALTMQGFTYPTTDGTSGQVLTTNGSKVLSFTTISGGGTAFANPSVESISGSLLITANTFTSGAANLTHLTASAQNQSNLVFKDNNLTGTTIISGSNNIFTNPTAPATGRVNYIGGSSNLFLNGQSDQLPTITGSAASVSGNRPTMNSNIINGAQAWTINQAVNPGSHTYSNNILAGTGTWTFNTLGNTGNVSVSNNISIGASLLLNSPSRSVAQINAGESGSNAIQIVNNTIQGALTYNGPVSSSIQAINQNSIAGNVTFNLQSGSRTMTVQANIINGNFTMNDNTVFAPTLGSQNVMTNNNINGAAILNQRASSSVQLSNNNINSWTISNDYDASSVTNANARTLAITGNALFGAFGNNLYASGSSGALSGSKVFTNNLFAGSNISASSISDGQAANMYATIGAGHGLTIEGTAIRNNSNNLGDGATMGSAFFGRWNKTGQGFNTTGEVILAVGTGTSGSTGITRKTGFLIDSGSNTFVEGTLNVSGSTTLSGSLYIQSASAFPTQIGTSLITWDATTGQVGQATTSTLISSSFSAGEFYSMTTLSGSSGVSASIELPNTAISNGVSIQSNSQIVVQNTGVYNIQFSAQADAFGGADTIWIWFKKNGTNIADSASKLIMQNNTAAIMTVNIFDNALPNDYFEVVWQNNAGAGKLISDAATGNIPGIPSVIVTVNQVK